MRGLVHQGLVIACKYHPQEMLIVGSSSDHAHLRSPIWLPFPSRPARVSHTTLRNEDQEGKCGQVRGSHLNSAAHLLTLLTVLFPAPRSNPQGLCRYLAATWAVLLIIGPFFTGHLRPDDSMRGRASMLANMRYHTSVIIVLFQSLGALAGASHSASKLGGFAHRIVAMQDISRTIAQGALMQLHGIQGQNNLLTASVSRLATAQVLCCLKCRMDSLLLAANLHREA